MEKNLSDNGRRLFRLPMFLVLLLVSGTFSCGKSGGDCFKSSGETITETRNVTDFNTIILSENTDVILTQDTLNSVTVEAGKNIISGITTTVTNGQLAIGNSNKCNWVRSYDKPLNVYVHVKQLKKLFYLAAGNVTSTDTLRSDTLQIDIGGGCGNITLSIHVTQGYVYEHLGTADVYLNGIAKFNSVSSGDFGLLQLKDLSTDFTFITNYGTNDVYVNVRQYLDARIQSIGNIYYTGHPDSVFTHISGAGQVIEF